MGDVQVAQKFTDKPINFYRIKKISCKGLEKFVK